MSKPLTASWSTLEQLKAGSPQIKKDIQQMVLAIPTLSKVINDSFGSIDKFQAALKKNPDEALTKIRRSREKYRSWKRRTV